MDSSPQPMPKPLRIVMVDDEEDFYNLVRDVLAEVKSFRGEVTWCDSYEQGLLTLSQNQPDLYIVDYCLGRNTGIDLVREAQARKIHTPFILLTGQGDQEIAVEALKAGVTDYLNKDQLDAPLMERALRHSLESAKSRTAVARMVEIIESTNDLVCSCEPNTVITYLNRAGRRLLGLGDGDDLASESLQQFYPPAALDQFLLVALPTVEREGYWSGETVLLARDGREIPVLQTVIAHKDANGATDCYSTTCRDITERKQAEHSQARLATAIEQTADVIIVTDPGGIIEYVNPAFERVTGYTRAEVIGQNPRLLKSGKHDAACYAEMWKALNHGRVWSGLLTNRRKNGGFYQTEITITPVNDSTGKIINHVAVSRDVTYQRSIEEQLRHAQKMEAIGRLAGGVAHDFNNILTVITGYCAMITQKTEVSDLRRHDIEEIQKSAERAAGLTRQLLAFSRRQLLNPTILDVNAIVVGLDKMLRRLIGENIELRTVLTPNINPIKADAGQVEQVIMNLAVNARDAMPQGGKLIIETAEVVLEQLRHQPTQNEFTPGQYVRICISDTGIGMTPEVKAHLFEPFFTTKGLGKGTGLGMATCYGIIKQSDGHILVYSEPGYGTTVKVYLPAVQDKALPVAAPPPTEDRPVKGHGTVLVVEDEDSLRELTACVLRDSGYTVLMAANGTEGLEMARANLRDLDLIVTDVIMPQMGGKEMIEKLGPLPPSTKVIYTSGYTDDALAEHGVLDPTVSFIEKPFSPSSLAHKVREVLDQPAPI